ncbi:MAG: serine protease Do [Blastocatellia bacterium]
MRVVLTHLVGSDKGKRERFDKERVSIGRAPDNDLHFNDGQRRVSSHHAEINRRGEGFLLHDLGSTNGTMINGRRVITSELNHDDMIEFGAGGPLLRFVVELDEGEQASAAQLAGDSPALTPRRTTERLPQAAPRKHNGPLLIAIVAAMLMGAVGGILLSVRLPVRSNNEEMSFAEVAEQNRPAVVFIRAEFELVDENGDVKLTDARTGSGFIVSASGLIVTNRHLIRDWEYNKPPQEWTGRITKLEIIQPGQRREDATPAEIYRVKDSNEPDVAILRIKLAQLRFVRGIEPDLSRVSQGEDVAVIGYPFGLDLLKQTHDEAIEPSLSTGIVSRIGQDFIQLNLRAYHGNSGGPVLNRKGEVIGILTAYVTSAQDIALVTPINAALELIRNTANLSARNALTERTHHDQ